MKNPTNPDSANESSAASSQLETTLLTLPTASNMLTTTAALTPGATGLSAATPVTSNPMIGGVNYGDGNFDFFDPQHWMLDGLLDFNYSYVPPLEGA